MFRMSLNKHKTDWKFLWNDILEQCQLQGKLAIRLEIYHTRLCKVLENGCACFYVTCPDFLD